MSLSTDCKAALLSFRYPSLPDKTTFCTNCGPFKAFTVTSSESQKSCDTGNKCSELNMALFLAFLGVIFISSCLGSDALAGGIEERKYDDPDVLDALDFAMNEFNAMQNNMYRLMPTKVSDATVQVRTHFENFGARQIIRLQASKNDF